MPDLAERSELLEIGHGGHVAGERVVTLTEIGETVPEPTPGVRDKVAERRALRDFLVAKLELREVTADRPIEIEGAPLHPAHDRRCGDTLCDRSELEERVRV